MYPPPAASAGIIAFSWQLSDDGNFALVEFVARDRKALLPILQSANPAVKAFEKGKAKAEDIEKEFKKHKKDFTLDDLEAVVAP